jgi:hypothetical protein
MIKINLIKSKNELTINSNFFGLEKFLNTHFFNNPIVKKFLNQYTNSVNNKGNLLRIITPIYLGATLYFGSDKYKSIRLGEVYDLIEKEKQHEEGLNETEKQLKKYEPVKKTLENDEINFKKKIETIKKLITQGSETIKILYNIPLNMPSKVWLDNFAIHDNKIQLNGSSLEFIEISEFMKTLQNNPLFQGVRLIRSEKSTIPLQDKVSEIANFEMVITRK